MTKCRLGEQDSSKELLARIGDIVILPYAKESVWWLEPGRFDQHYYGHHGGLTPQEMDDIVAFLKTRVREEPKEEHTASAR